jgi:hypothetical protein
MRSILFSGFILTRGAAGGVDALDREAAERLGEREEVLREEEDFRRVIGMAD